MAKATSENASGNIGETRRPVGIPVDVRPCDIERARRTLAGRLRMALIEIVNMGEIGVIHNLASDLRALDYLQPMQADPDLIKPAQPVPTRAEHDAEIQALSKEVGRKERARSVLTEVKGVSEDEAERMVR